MLRLIFLRKILAHKPATILILNVVCNLTKPMKHIFIIIILSTFWACNSKKDNAVSKIKNPNPEIVMQKKLSGKEVVAELEKLSYFYLTSESELDTVKADFAKLYFVAFIHQLFIESN